jgi:hypothetical protein
MMKKTRRQKKEGTLGILDYSLIDNITFHSIEGPKDYYESIFGNIDINNSEPIGAYKRVFGETFCDAEEEEEATTSVGTPSDEKLSSLNPL